MALFLVAIQHPDNYDPSIEDDAMAQDIAALNIEWWPPAYGFL